MKMNDTYKEALDRLDLITEEIEKNKYQKPLGLRFKTIVYIFKKYAMALFLDGALPHK